MVNFRQLEYFDRRTSLTNWFGWPIEHSLEPVKCVKGCTWDAHEIFQRNEREEKNERRRFFCVTGKIYTTLAHYHMWITELNIYKWSSIRLNVFTTITLSRCAKLFMNDDCFEIPRNKMIIIRRNSSFLLSKIKWPFHFNHTNGSSVNRLKEWYLLTEKYHLESYTLRAIL